MIMSTPERRINERFEITLPVSGRCSTSWKNTHPFQGETKDVSSRGFCVKIEGHNGYAEGQDVKFSTRLYSGDFLIKGRGKICWVTTPSEPEPATIMGVMLTRMRHFSLWQERIEVARELLQTARGKLQSEEVSWSANALSNAIKTALHELRTDLPLHSQRSGDIEIVIRNLPQNLRLAILAAVDSSE